MANNNRNELFLLPLLVTLFIIGLMFIDPVVSVVVGLLIVLYVGAVSLRNRYRRGTA